MGVRSSLVARRGQQVVAGDRLADRIGIGVLAKVFPPELVDRVVDEAGVRERRTRTLPSRVVVYYPLAMVLFFQSGYGEVWNKLVAGLDWARQFRVRLVAVDGMCLDLPDTPENGAEFGYPGNDAGRGPFPQIRVVGLGECGTRAVLGAATSPLATGEQPLTRQLLGRLSPGDLLAADRNFLSHGLLAEMLAAGVHVLWRAKSDVDLPVLEVLPDGTWLSRIADPAASRRMRRKGAAGKDIPGITVRVIEYSVASEDGSETSETFTLVTDLIDPALLTPGQAAGAYASRWQLETCFDELETSIRGGAAVVLRSKSPPTMRAWIRPGSPSPAPATGSAAASATPDAFPPDRLDDLAADLAFEITFARNLVPGRPGRRYERKTKRPGGRYKTRKPGETARLTPLTRVVFWLLPVPVLT